MRHSALPDCLRHTNAALSHASVKALAQGNRAMLDAHAAAAGIDPEGMSVRAVVERLWAEVEDFAEKPEIAYRAHILADLDWEHDAVISEQRVGARRIDLITINDAGPVGWEIKSDYDTLMRLGEQVQAYQNALPQVTVLSGNRHVSEVADVVPERVGVCTLERMVHEPACTPEETSPTAIFEMLRRPEAVEVLHLLGQPVPNAAPVYIWRALRDAFESLDSREVCEAAWGVLHRSRHHRFWRIIEGLPAGLQPAAIGVRLTIAQWGTLGRIVDD